MRRVRAWHNALAVTCLPCRPYPPSSTYPLASAPTSISVIITYSQLFRFVKTKLQLFDMGKAGPITVARETIKSDGASHHAAFPPQPNTTLRSHLTRMRAPALTHHAALPPPTAPLPDPAGVLGLYRGLSSLLAFSVPKVATRFFAFETLRNSLQVRASLEEAVAGPRRLPPTFATSLAAPPRWWRCTKAAARRTDYY